MKNKGFTLIELLAVIVILAIIALIATPIVLNIINDSRKESIRLSAENYLDAVEVSLANAYMKDNDILLSDIYEISENGKKLISKTNNKEINIEFDGTPIREGRLEVYNGNVEQIYIGEIGNWYVVIIYNKVKLFDKSQKSILSSGTEFNSKIKNLANEITNANHNTQDNLIISIEFLSYGRIPSGYTEEKLKQLPKVDVSDNNETILAFYDEEEGKMFIYSENLIEFNEDSSIMFANLQSLKNIVFNNINVSSVKNMSQMFRTCIGLESLNFISFNTISLTDMSDMFFQCDELRKIDFKNLDTSNVTNMSGMFMWCNFENLDLSVLNTSSLKSMGSMFAYCTKLKKLDLRNLDVSQVESSGSLFYSVPPDIYITTNDEITRTWLQEKLGTGKGTVEIVADLTQQ